MEKWLTETDQVEPKKLEFHPDGAPKSSPPSGVSERPIGYISDDHSAVCDEVAKVDDGVLSAEEFEALGSGKPMRDIMQDLTLTLALALALAPVSYTHLTLPTTPYV